MVLRSPRALLFYWMALVEKKHRQPKTHNPHLPVPYIFGSPGVESRYLIYISLPGRNRFQIYRELEDEGNAWQGPGIMKITDLMISHVCFKTMSSFLNLDWEIGWKPKMISRYQVSAFEFSFRNNKQIGNKGWQELACQWCLMLSSTRWAPTS